MCKTNCFQGVCLIQRSCCSLTLGSKFPNLEQVSPSSLVTMSTWPPVYIRPSWRMMQLSCKQYLDIGYAGEVTNVTSSRGGCIEVEIKRLSIACPLGNAQGDQLYVSAMECMYPPNFLYPQCSNYKSPTLKWGYEIKTKH